MIPAAGKYYCYLHALLVRKKQYQVVRNVAGSSSTLNKVFGGPCTPQRLNSRPQKKIFCTLRRGTGISHLWCMLSPIFDISGPSGLIFNTDYVGLNTDILIRERPFFPTDQKVLTFRWLEDMCFR